METFAYLEMTFSGKQDPNRATTQSKLGEYLANIVTKSLIKFSVSVLFNLLKQMADKPTRHLIALHPIQ